MEADLLEANSHCSMVVGGPEEAHLDQTIPDLVEADAVLPMCFLLEVQFRLIDFQREVL